ncbi:Reverse transcriptase zinc-binding domain [Arabidopsis suecica]|uniref:Reverse transcriptase zinc-binding domain n=1 Tax=Arabidopsis suecica TaxID=45249 RepID=A0A8T1ZSA3_ARASU|nr:Reverse transcriptase zinc-binding domain [Arabidopsis suecica]
MGPVPFAEKDLLVEDLFLHGTVDWDHDKVWSLFPNYALEILAIKPSRLGASDKRVWLASSDGLYTTKSGYAIAREEMSSLDHHKDSGGCDWIKEVWGIKSSPKVKHFLWKALAGAIPTGLQLVSRGMQVDSRCIRCNEPESVCHLLFNCPFAKQVWKLAPLVSLEEMPAVNEVHKGLSWLREKKCLPPTGLSKGPLYTWICWNLWLARNQKVFSNRVFSEAETLLKAVLDAKEWQEAQGEATTSGGIRGFPPQGISSVVPFSSSVKSDAAWNQNSRTAGISWIFSSQVLTLPQRHSAICEHVSSPLMAECLAIRSALLSALEFGIQSLSLQTDCQILAKAIASKNLLVEVHGALSDVFICISRFKEFSCSFIPRGANVEADALAKTALSVFVANF